MTASQTSVREFIAEAEDRLEMLETRRNPPKGSGCSIYVMMVHALPCGEASNVRSSVTASAPLTAAWQSRSLRPRLRYPHRIPRLRQLAKASKTKLTGGWQTSTTCSSNFQHARAGTLGRRSLVGWCGGADGRVDLPYAQSRNSGGLLPPSRQKMGHAMGTGARAFGIRLRAYSTP
jgi:hypothetical protein